MNGVEQFDIKTTNLTCGYRSFGRCTNTRNKSVTRRKVFVTERNAQCSEEFCPIKL